MPKRCPNVNTNAVIGYTADRIPIMSLGFTVYSASGDVIGEAKSRYRLADSRTGWSEQYTGVPSADEVPFGYLTKDWVYDATADGTVDEFLMGYAKLDGDYVTATFVTPEYPYQIMFRPTLP